MPKLSLSRRRFLQGTAGAALTLPQLETRLLAADESKPFQAMGARAAEITPTTAIIWTRLTAVPMRVSDATPFPKRIGAKPGKEDDVTVPIAELDGACPGMVGRLRLRYSTHEDLKDAMETPWYDITAHDDFIQHFPIADLKPSTVYYYASEAAAVDQVKVTSTARGQFETAIALGEPSDLTFCVMTCQGYADRDHKDGHNIYPSMLALKPRFAVLTGDLVYYDNDAPRAVSIDLAHYHWQRMFSLPRLLEFTRNVATYWQKDDHDTLKDDSWPGQRLGELTFAQGEAIFKTQAAMGDGVCYRTVRWGRDLQIWFSEGRDYRSPNIQKDGPEKTIWGQEQKDWFKKTVKDSTATWKILVSPTPLVGPDRRGKNDNHSNAGFEHEGEELRGWLQANAPDNFFVICGDRHWQYDSIHPKTKVREFSVGPASNEHASGSPGEDKTYHQFHRVQGGFLSVTVRPEGKKSNLLFQLRDVHGKVAHEVAFSRAAG